MVWKYIILKILLTQIIFMSCSQNKEYLKGDDIRLFKGTKVWPLAKAVEEQDTLNIKKYIQKDNLPVDFQEDKFGKTLLMWAVKNNKYKSVKKLLELGANPNLQDSYYGSSALMEASGYGPHWDKSTRILELLLKHGGNPNAIQKGTRPEGNRTRKTPLIIAAGCCLEKVKLLVEAGANINFINEFNESPLKSAILLAGKESPYITEYLLIKKKANVPKSFGQTVQGDTITVFDLLNTWEFKEGSESQKIKNKIIEYLKEK